jgi:hypothetical protein
MVHPDNRALYSWWDIVRSFCLTNIVAIAGGRAHRSQFSAANIPGCFQEPRSRATEFSRRPGTCGLDDAKPTPGVIRVGDIPDAWACNSATVERPRPRRYCGERPSDATRYSNISNTGWRDGR